MQINNVHSCDECITTTKVTNDKSKMTNFEDILIKEVKRNLTYEDLVKDIEKYHNAKIVLSPDASFCNSITGLNNVIIGKSTLEKMTNDSVFRKKIMKVIDECCSFSAQQEIESLSPPAKSAGVIIYPDGSYLCWIESIYSDRTDVKKDNNTDDLLVKAIDKIKESQVADGVEPFNDLKIMPYNFYIYKSLGPYKESDREFRMTEE